MSKIRTRCICTYIHLVYFFFFFLKREGYEIFTISSCQISYTFTRMCFRCKTFRQPVRFCCTYSQEKPSDAEKNRQPNGTVKIKGVLPVQTLLKVTEEIQVKLLAAKNVPPLSEGFKKSHIFVAQVILQQVLYQCIHSVFARLVLTQVKTGQPCAP